MSCMMKKIIKALPAFLFMLFASCINAAAETDGSVPMLSRENLQYAFEKKTVNNNLTVLIVILVFAGIAVIIPIALYFIDMMIKKKSEKSPKKTK